MALWINSTGDVITGDVVEFQEGVFRGFAGHSQFSHSRPTCLGARRVVAEVIRDSYGSDKQQHTFTLRVLASDGAEPLAPGTVTTRKGRNVYRNGVRRIEWADEAARDDAAAEKHDRGDKARAARAIRRQLCESET